MKIKSIGSPILPRNAVDPAAQFGNLRRANVTNKKRYRNIQIGMRDLIRGVDKRIVSDDKGGIVANIKYEYIIDPQKFQSISLFIQRLLYEELLDDAQGQLTDRWWLRAHLDEAFLDGTTDALQSSKNMATIEAVGPELSGAMRSIQIEQVVFSRPFQNRIALVQSRVFNGMRGLADTTKADLADTLARGMARGVGVQELTGDVMDRIGVSFRRSQRIVRTEILNSYRTASREETKQLNEDVYDGSDWVMEQLWFSALAPTSRRWHVARHGKIFTPDEVEEFYSKNGNPINCLCSQSPILINRKTREVLKEDLLKRMGVRRDLLLPVMPVKRGQPK